MPDSDPNDITRSHVQLAHGSIIGHYRIIERIGAGGMGEVYLAEDTKLDRKVALKFLPLHLCQDPECRARFTREAQAAAKLNHPNIVTIHEVSEFNGRPFFAMENVEGVTIRDLRKDKDLPLSRIIELAIQICEGLAKAHSGGIVHRDIKPSNILIDQDGRAKIVDFGLASVHGSEHLTKTGSTLGTVGYMSPEQARGEEVDARSDLFSFGVVLYELITGRSPFQAESEIATIKNVIEAVPEPLARYKNGVPDELQRIISKALAKDKNLRYQHVDDLVADLKGMVSQVGIATTVRKRRIRVVVPSLVILGLIVTALVLKPWRFEMSSTEESQAATNWLAVMYFDNVAEPSDSKRLGEIATNLLITGLSQSEHIRVMSSQRLYDLLKQMGKEGVKTIDRATASQIAKKAEAKWMLTGSILQGEPTIVLTSQLIDVSSGGVVASQRITGNQGENIFAVIDRLTEDVKKSSTLPGALKAEPFIRVADVTTHSPEAYRYYLEGVEYKHKGYYEEARRSLQKAIELDSTFALAYGNLAIVSEGKEWEEAIAMAVKYADRASDRDRQRIMRIQAYLHGDHEKAIAILQAYLLRYSEDKEMWSILADAYFRRGNCYDSVILCCNRVLALDPNFKQAYNHLAYSYNALGQHDMAMEAINKYITMAPNEANPYDSRGDLYASAGKLDSAIESYRKALAIKPGFPGTDFKLGYTYIFAGQFPEAGKSLQAYLSGCDKLTRGLMRGVLAEIPMYQGKFREALQILNDCVAANRLDEMEGENALPLMYMAYLHDIIGQADSAVAAGGAVIGMAERLVPLKSVSSREVRFGFTSEYAILLYCAGDTAGARVQLGLVEDSMNSLSAQTLSGFWYAKGRIASLQKNTGRAIEFLTRADSIRTSPDSRYWLAQVYLETGNPARAVALLENLISNYLQLQGGFAIILPRALYILGQAYEQTGSTDKARATYERFLTIWKYADPGIKEIDDAKARLARLKAKS